MPTLRPLERNLFLHLALAVWAATHSAPGVAIGPESHKYFVADSGRAIPSLCVAVAYKKASGVSVGPDGKGGNRTMDRILLKPFRYASTENFYEKIDRNKSIIIPIPPFFAVGGGHITSAAVFLKPGFIPLAMHGSDRAITETFSLKTDATKQAEQVVAAILARDVDSPLLRRLFILTSSKMEQQEAKLMVDYDAADEELLRSCLSDSQTNP